MAEGSGSGGGLAQLLGDIPTLIEKFATVATQDPLAAVSLAMGALLVVAASGVLGYLTLGAVLELLGAVQAPR
ncbi:MAG: hypothetical protein ABEH90_06050 [Halolamina sp.]